MGIGDKKSVLRGMYQKPATDAPTEAPTPGPPSSVRRSEQIEARFDALIFHFIHALLYILFLIGIAGMLAALHSHYTDGLALASTNRIEKYARDAMYLVGLAVFFIVIGVSLFAFFRKKLPARARWFAFAAVLSLFPLAILSSCFFSACFHAGHAAALAKLNAAQLTTESQTLAAAVPLPDGQPLEITSSDTRFSSLMKYAGDVLHADRARIYPRGVVIIMPSGGPFDDAEGLIIPATPLSPADAKSLADTYNLDLLPLSPPILHFTSEPNLKFLENPATPSSLPALSPWTGR